LASQLDRATGQITPAKLSLPLDTVINPAPPGAAGFPYLAEEGIYMGLSYQADASDGRGPNAGCEYDQVIGVVTVDNRGPNSQISALGTVPPLWHGFITQDGGTAGQGMFVFASNFRFVAKVATLFRNPNAEMTGFVGLIQDATGPGLTPVVATLTDPALAPPDHHYIGFQFDTRAPAPFWRFWTRGSSGVDNLVTTGASIDPLGTEVRGPFYFVIETNRITIGNLDSVICKMGVYDANKVLVSNIAVTHKDLLPLPGGRGLFTSVAVRENLVPNGAGTIFFYSAKVILDTDIDDLPPLP
jgi:hypothetical protein